MECKVLFFKLADQMLVKGEQSTFKFFASVMDYKLHLGNESMSLWLFGMTTRIRSLIKDQDSSSILRQECEIKVLISTASQP